MSTEASKKTTHFGYQEVPVEEKSTRVANVFHAVAPQYDLMNDLMSFGLHRLWKRFTIHQAALRPGQSVLDIASGTGDLARLAAKQVGPTGQVIMTDRNETMLQLGRDKLTNAGIIVQQVLADAEQLPFTDQTFDCITVAFGLRNMTHPATALRAMHRVLKPGGRLFILEFSHPTIPGLNTLYDDYSFRLIPKLGQLVTHHADHYQYLVESIRQHPDQETLKALLLECGMDEVTYYNLSGGIVALHQGNKY